MYSKFFRRFALPELLVVGRFPDWLRLLSRAEAPPPLSHLVLLADISAYSFFYQEIYIYIYICIGLYINKQQMMLPL